jgi:hypothetical protein
MKTAPEPTAYFQRYEQKYLLNPAQYHAVVGILNEHGYLDDYGLTTIYSLYYDTLDFAIARKSRDKTAYKEKLRVRSYGIPSTGDTIYWELKKKLRGVVYKQRNPAPFTPETFKFLGDTHTPVCDEIRWFFSYYRLLPKCLIICERLSLRDIEHAGLRITFDTRVRFRTLPFDFPPGHLSTPLLDENIFLMEIKTYGAIPLFLSAGLSSLNIFPVAFSKYRAAFENIMCKQGARYA